MYFSEVKPGFVFRHSHLADFLWRNHLTSQSPSFVSVSYCEEEVKCLCEVPSPGLGNQELNKGGHECCGLNPCCVITMILV